MFVSISDCRPCSEAELLRAYCSSDFGRYIFIEYFRRVDADFFTPVFQLLSALSENNGQTVSCTRNAFLKQYTASGEH